EVQRLLREEAADHLRIEREEAIAREEAERLAREWDHFRWNWFAAIGFAAVLVPLFSLSDAAVERGVLSGEAVRDGEGWRLVTALTLHADVRHLLANLVVGTLAFGAVCGYLGPGVGLLGTLAVGALGNLFSVWIHSPDYAALGASTAIFGILGLL